MPKHYKESRQVRRASERSAVKSKVSKLKKIAKKSKVKGGSAIVRRNTK